jgi:protein-S-isoprenylcysteine O-methyltransferase Ste14
MYVAFITMGFGYLFLSSNWFIGLTWLLGTVLSIVTRYEAEETMMIDQFGDEYRAYMQRTGKFFPQVGSRPR